MVWTVIVLQNGNIASGSGDQTIKIWNSTTGALIQTLTGHTGGVLRLTVLQTFSTQFSSNYPNQVWALTVLKNGNLAVGSHEGSIRILNQTTGDLIQTFTGHTWGNLCINCSSKR